LGRLVKNPGGLPNLDPDPMIELIAASILQAILAIKAPELAGALLSGGSGLTAGSVTGTAGGAFRTVAASASMAVNAAKAVGNLAMAAKAGASGVKGGAGSLPTAPAGMGAHHSRPNPG